jgi:predicted nuclease of predicted toxin-antitoxin system
MVRLVTDENFSDKISQELLRQRPQLDLVRVQDVGLRSADDPSVLEWAAKEDRILLTHDRQTMPKYAYDRLRANRPMPGVLVVSQDTAIGKVVEEVLTQLEASLAGEWEGQVKYVPL